MQRLSFHARHLAAVRNGSKRITMRYRDPIDVGPALLVFELPEEVVLAGRILRTIVKTVAEVTDEEARADGVPDRTALLPMLREYYPDLQPSDEIVLVSFDVDVDVDAEEA